MAPRCCINYQTCVVRSTVVGCLITILLIYHKTNWLNNFNKTENHESEDISTNVNVIGSSDDIIILYWKDPYNIAPLKYWADQASACVPNCKIVADRIYLNVSDAVLFNSADLRNLGKDNMPSIRPTYQPWVFAQGESPAYTYLNLNQFPNVFNWTMTYRRDSDISMTYGSIERLRNTSPVTPTHINDQLVMLRNKTKMAAWIVSNCRTHSNREKYVTQLQNYISVDIYGGCGSPSCTRSGADGCFPQIEKQYKFYLAFENSLCTEYITEKFFNPLKYNLVPIVYGGGDYQSIAPPHSYIDTKDFESPKALAKYLRFLDKNPDKYLEYFEWKPKYKIVKGRGFCDVCLKAKHHRINPITKIYRNISDWWFNTRVEMKEKGDGMSVTRLSTKMNSPSCSAGFESKSKSNQLI